MTTTIAVAGKGGTGKTTITALLIELLSKKGVVLAIDGDPSSNLNMALGLPLTDTVGDVREDMMEAVQSRSLDASIPKQDYLDLKIAEALVESKGIDLLAMGRPEGPGCYCAANNMLRMCLQRLVKNYDYMVVDCEAGMEHVSRQTTQDVDVLLLVSDHTMRGIITAARMKDLIWELRSSVGRIALVVNKVHNGLSPEIEKAIGDFDLALVGVVPVDENVANLDASGAPLIDLPPDSPIRLAVRDIAEKSKLT